MAPHCHRSLFFLKPAAKLSLHTIVPPWVTLHVRQTQKSRRLLSPLAKLPSLGNASFLCVVLVGLTTTFHSAMNLPFTARQTHPHPLSADASSLGHPALPRTDATRGNFVLGIQDFSPDGTLQPPRNSFGTRGKVFWSPDHSRHFAFVSALLSPSSSSSQDNSFPVYLHVAPTPNHDPTQMHTQAGFPGNACRRSLPGTTRIKTGAEGRNGPTSPPPLQLPGPGRVLSTSHVSTLHSASAK